jgi:hypothetical protein
VGPGLGADPYSPDARGKELRKQSEPLENVRTPKPRAQRAPSGQRPTIARAAGLFFSSVIV